MFTHTHTQKPSALSTKCVTLDCLSAWLTPSSNLWWGPFQMTLDDKNLSQITSCNHHIVFKCMKTPLQMTSDDKNLSQISSCNHHIVFKPTKAPFQMNLDDKNLSQISSCNHWIIFKFMKAFFQMTSGDKNLSQIRICSCNYHANHYNHRWKTMPLLCIWLLQ